MKFLALFFVVFSSVGAWSNEGAGEKIGKKVDQSVTGVSDYSKEQKEKIQKEFKDQLAVLDQEISDIRAKANKLKSTASVETKKQVNDQISFLEKRRSELKSDFKALQSSSGRAWDLIKSGFQDSMGTLKESFKKAKQEFQSEDQK